MRSCSHLARGIVAALIFVVSNTAAAGESRKLAAPVYPNAVPAVPADGVQVDPRLVLTFDGGKTLDCQATTGATDIAGRPIPAGSVDLPSSAAGPWCFLTRDPVEKVIAFYEKSAGSLRATQDHKGMRGYSAFTERAWFTDIGEGGGSDYLYAGLTLHALPPPPVKGQAPAAAAMGDETWAGQEDYGFYAQTRFFGVFMDAVDYFGAADKRAAAELDGLYARRNKIESAYFQHRGPNFTPVHETLLQQYSERRNQRMQSIETDMSAAIQYPGAMPQSSVGPTAAEDATFNAAMAADPDLQQRYVALTQKGMTLMQQGKDEEADAVFAEIEELEAAHPELSAMNGQQQARVAKAQAADQAAADAFQARFNQQLDDAIWGSGLELLDALEKEDYYTLIIIDNGFSESETDYTKDRAIIDAATPGMIPHARIDAWGIDYVTVQPNAATRDEQAEPEKKERTGGRLKKGLGKLKDLTGN